MIAMLIGLCLGFIVNVYGITLPELAGCWENRTTDTGNGAYSEFQFVMSSNGNAILSLSQWSISAAGAAGNVFTRPTTNSAFDASDGTFNFRTALPIGGVLGGGDPIVMNYAFTSLTFDRIRGQSSMGNVVQPLDMRRPVRAVACRAALPVRITPNPTMATMLATQSTAEPMSLPINASASVTTERNESSATVPSSHSGSPGVTATSPATSNTNLPPSSTAEFVFIPTPPPSNDNTALIGGIVGGIIALLLVVGLTAAAVFVCKRRAKATQNEDNKSAAATTFQSPNTSNYGRIAPSHYSDRGVVDHPPNNHYDVLKSNEIGNGDLT